MSILHKVSLDMQQPAQRIVIHAKQGDSLSREVAMNLYDGGAIWTPPAEAAIKQIVYCKPDGTGGCYDTMPDNSAAVTVASNVATLRLHPQMFAVAGLVQCELRLMSTDGMRISSFNFWIDVEASADSGITSQDYYRFATIEGLSAAAGDLTHLSTTAKNSLVAAINELVAEVGGNANELLIQKGQIEEVSELLADHQHRVEDITDFPETMPPDAHEHTGYAPTEHGHIADDVQYQGIIGNTAAHDVGEALDALVAEVGGKAPAEHEHTGYAPAEHEHPAADIRCQMAAPFQAQSVDRALDELATAIGGKAPTEHGHIAETIPIQNPDKGGIDAQDLQTALDQIANALEAMPSETDVNAMTEAVNAVLAELVGGGT